MLIRSVLATAAAFLLTASAILPAIAIRPVPSDSISAPVEVQTQTTDAPTVLLSVEDISLEKIDTLDRSQSELELTVESLTLSETTETVEPEEADSANEPVSSEEYDEPQETDNSAQTVESALETSAAMSDAVTKTTPVAEASATSGYTAPQASAADSEILLLGWFDTVSDVFARGDAAYVTDLATGIRVEIARTGGTNHADCEAIDSTQTASLLQIAGGSWNWDRRPILVEVDGLRIAASMTLRPHAGRDDKPALTRVTNRSGGFGTGTNYDTIKDNSMEGHFDIHFYGSKTHVNNSKDVKHQAAIQIAFHSED